MQRRGLRAQTRNIQAISPLQHVPSVWRCCRSHPGTVLPSSPLFVQVSWGTDSLLVYPNYLGDLAKLPLKSPLQKAPGLRSPVWLSKSLQQGGKRSLLWLSPVWGRPCEGLLQLGFVLAALHIGNLGRWEVAGTVALPFSAHQPAPAVFCSSHPLLLLTPFSFFPALLWAKHIV